MSDRIEEISKTYAYNWRKDHPESSKEMVSEIQNAFLRGGQCAETMLTLWLPVMNNDLGLKGIETNLPVLFRKKDKRGLYCLADHLNWDLWEIELKDRPDDWYWRKIVDLL